MSDAVLIVDDSLTVRMDLAEAFEAAGFSAVLCASAAEARAQVERIPIAIAILDVVLPDGHGLDLLQELRVMPSMAGVPILMLSTEAEVRDRIRGLQVGADDYVGKPYDRGYVIERARDLMRRHQPATPPITTILVVDDSATFREELRQALVNAGYEVLTASSGQEGLRIAASNRPTALIVDGVMPGLDGTTLIRRIRMDAALRGTPCVMLTASEDAAAEPFALDAGADAFVRKEESLEVILARLAAVLRGAHTPPADADALSGPKRILVVDDSETFLQQIAEVLRGDGFDVVMARSGEEAIEMLAAQPVDCVLLDLVMPGLSGKDTCRRMKSSPVVRDIPLIMVTSVEDREAMIEGLAIGADDYIAKSSEFEVLKARVRAQLRRKQFEDEHRHIREELLRSELDAAEARAAREVAETRAALTEELERKNKELEAFNYSVSHDLRAPLRAIDGFSQMLLSEYEGALDATGQGHLRRVRAAAQKMTEIVDALLDLSRVGRTQIARGPVNISNLAQDITDELRRREPDRTVDIEIQSDLVVDADRRLARVLLDNLIGNAWKFTVRTPDARVVVGAEKRDGRMVYSVRDNGAGFNMTYVDRLFSPFQRLHSEADFPGTGIGLATVQRIVDRHGGRVWAEGAVDQGATVFFTLPSGATGAGSGQSPSGALRSSQ